MSNIVCCVHCTALIASIHFPQSVAHISAAEDGDSDAFIKSLIHMKEREIALALMRVAELTRQLEQLKQGSVDRHILTDSTLVNAQLLEKQPDVS